MSFKLVFLFIVGLICGSYAAIKQSDLTSMTFGESTMDMVASMTQKSINAIVNSFLLETSNHDELAVVYQFDGSAFHPVPKDEAIKTLGCDPFEVPDGANSDSNTCVANLLANTMNFGIRAVHGVPSQIVGTERFTSFQSILLDVQYSAVTYNLMTSEFQTFELQPDYTTNSVSLSAVSQDEYLAENDENTPFSFPFDLEITVREERAVGNLDKLPEATKKMIEGNLTQFYSIQTPTAPLNDGTLRNVPDIPGISGMSSIHTYLKPFMNEFVTVQDPTNLGIGLGMFVLADRYPRRQWFEIPTRMQISTSPALNPDQSKSTDYDAYTLTFQMVTEDNDLVTPRSFPWNWVEPGDQKRVQATAAIRRGVLVDYLKEILSPELDEACFGARSFFDDDNNIVWELGACAVEPNFEILETPDSGTVLKYIQPRDGEDATLVKNENSCISYLDSHLESYVLFETGNTITVYSQLRISGKITNNTVQSGLIDIVNKAVRREYVLGVDGAGGITVTLKPLEEVQNSALSSFKRPTSADFNGALSPESADRLVSSVYDSLPDISTFMADYSGAIEARLNSFPKFVFAEKCDMVNIMFSNTLDVVSLVDILNDEQSKHQAPKKTKLSKPISKQAFKVADLSSTASGTKKKTKMNKRGGEKISSCSAGKCSAGKKTRACGSHHMDLCNAKF